jgi:hypothetical protein
MRRVSILVLAVTLFSLSAQAASATSGAHFFHKASKSSVNDQGALVVSWDEAGLGNQNVTYTLTADATVAASSRASCPEGQLNKPAERGPVVRLA